MNEDVKKIICKRKREKIRNMHMQRRKTIGMYV